MPSKHKEWLLSRGWIQHPTQIPAAELWEWGGVLTLICRCAGLGEYESWEMIKEPTHHTTAATPAQAIVSETEYHQQRRNALVAATLPEQAETQQRLQQLRMQFDALGGRSVELAEEIDLLTTAVAEADET